MKTRNALIVILMVVTSACASDSSLLASPCAGLFKRESSASDSLPGEFHVPEEARETISTSSDLQTPQAPMKQPICELAAGKLNVETIYQSDLRGGFQLSPSGNQIAIHPYGNNQLIIYDLLDGKRRELVASGVPLFWTDEHHIFLNREGQPRWYSLNPDTGETEPYDSRWEYNEPDDSRFTQTMYTGWQAAAALQVKDEVVCRAVRNGKLHTITASDGSLLLQREELLKYGTEIVRAEYLNSLLSSQEITDLREQTPLVVSVDRVWIDAPLEQGYQNKSWQRLLILTAMPQAPHNLIIHVASEIHWLQYPKVINQERIAVQTIWDNDFIYEEFMVSANYCAKDNSAKAYILYKKKADGQYLAVSEIPYRDTSKEVDGLSEMVLSPDGKYIYLDEWESGQYKIHRLWLR
jgi:hypothetical protein